jgi:hypothetical protein
MRRAHEDETREADVQEELLSGEEPNVYIGRRKQPTPHAEVRGRC